MTIRELINELLDSPMDTEIGLHLEGNHIDEYGEECSGWMFPIDSIEHGSLIKFTDWRTEQTEPQRGCDADCTEDCTECAKETELWKAEQTEPNSSEIPNNCEDEDIFEYCPRCGMRILVGKPKDEPQNHSGEATEMVEDKPQVDDLIRQADEMIKFDEELLQMGEPQYHAEIECNYKDCCGWGEREGADNGRKMETL